MPWRAGAVALVLAASLAVVAATPPSPPQRVASMPAGGSSWLTRSWATTTVPPTTVAPDPVPSEPTAPETTQAPTQQAQGRSRASTAVSEAPSDMEGMPAGCIRRYESGGTTDEGGNYGDSGGGAYQIVHGTWDGYGGYSDAEDAPASVQDAKAAELWAENGHAHWAAQRGRCF